jgi:cation:H+ antiporter
MNFVFSIILMIFSCLIIWRSAAGFEMASDYLGRKLTHGVKGATINAIASSMPEFLSTFFFLFYLRDVNGFSGGLGITAGSSIFNLLVIPAAVVMVITFKNPKKSLEVTRNVLRRDGIVLIATILVLIIVIDQEVLRWTHGAVLVLTYLVYLVYMFANIKKYRKEEAEIITPVREIPNQSVLVKILTLKLECLVIGKREIQPSNAWVLLFLSTLVMSLGTWLLVLGTEMLSEGLHIPILFVAVILSAAASSVPDTVISIKDAKKGNYDDAISNALGSNIFDISFALGLPLLVYTLLFGDIVMQPAIREMSAGLWMFLLITTVLGALIFNAGKYLNKTKAIIFFLIYGVFVFYVFGQAFQMDLMVKISDILLRLVQWIESLLIR